MADDLESVPEPTDTKTDATTMTRALLRILEETEAITEETKARIRKSVESSVDAVAPYLRRRYELLVLNSAFLAKVPNLMLPVVLVGPFFVFQERAEFEGLALLTAVALSMIAVLAGVMVGSLLLLPIFGYTFRSLGLEERVPAFAGTAAVFLFVGIVIGSPPESGLARVLFRSGLWIPGLFFAAFLVIAQSFHLAQVLTVRKTIRKVPDAEVVAALLLNLGGAEQIVRRWEARERSGVSQSVATESDSSSAGNSPELALLSELDGMLHQLANTIEQALPSRFSGSAIHLETERWLRAEGRAISAAVHRMRQEMLLGGKGGLERLIAGLGTMLAQLAEGDWASVARADPDTVGPSTFSRLLPRLRALVVAVLPVLIGLGLQSGIIPIDTSPEFVEGVVRFGVGWAVLHGFLLLDARVTEKIGQTERLMTFLQ